tara:strand:+ start:25781 stop:26647 length:867 start_codon:yes stop_codon:yes gene_type:complete
MKIKQAFFIIICLFYTNKLRSFTSSINLKLNYTISQNDKINILQDSLKAKLDIIQNGIDENEKLLANQEFVSILRRTLNLKNSFDFTFDSLNTISILQSPDNYFKIYNWFIENDDDTYRFYAMIQFKNTKKDVVFLNDNSDDILNVEQAELSSDSWYGCLYYNIIKNKAKKSYTIIGWDGNNEFSTKKIIDVVRFNSYNNIKFGAPIFKDDKQKSKKRVIIEYNNQSPVSVQFNKKSKQIIFNNLVPQKKELEGIKSYYVPDGSFNAYEYKKGKWWLIKDIDARNQDN